MTEEEVRRQAEAVALGIYVVKATFFQPPDDCEIVETVAPLARSTASRSGVDRLGPTMRPWQGSPLSGAG
jgi:hypothetical protein